MYPEPDHVCYTPTFFVSLHLSYCVPLVVSLPLIMSLFWILCISHSLFLYLYFSNFLYLFEIPIFPFPSLQVNLLCDPLSLGHALERLIILCILFHINWISEHVLPPKPYSDVTYVVCNYNNKYIYFTLLITYLFLKINQHLLELIGHFSLNWLTNCTMAVP